MPYESPHSTEYFRPCTASIFFPSFVIIKGCDDLWLNGGNVNDCGFLGAGRIRWGARGMS
jgi:hypothetical protein